MLMFPHSVELSEFSGGLCDSLLHQDGWDMLVLACLQFPDASYHSQQNVISFLMLLKILPVKIPVLGVFSE